MRWIAVSLSLVLCGCTGVARVSEPRGYEVPALDNAWYSAATNELADTLNTRRPGTRARNLILFIGDGMSLATVTAARILEGQRRGESGEENLLAFENFSHTGLAKVYNTDSQVPDSAGTATAMLSGVKTLLGVIGVDERVARDNCAALADHAVPSLLEHAERAGLATGVISTARITHATPASAYAHTPNRGWEAETLAGSGCVDIATQLVEFDVGDGIEVLLGGGRGPFLPVGMADPEYPAQTGWRNDGQNLIAQWQQRNPGGIYVWNAGQFDAANPARTRRLLGLFEPDHMQYEADRTSGANGEPALSDMVEKAIRILDRDERGYFLFVEGGRIDHAHHVSNAYRALHDTIAMSDAVRRAREMTDREDTLIVVTADHGHVMEIAGYPRRGNPILGKVVGTFGPNAGEYTRDALGLPYTTLVYGNGPGYTGASDQQGEGPKSAPHEFAKYEGITRGRADLSTVDTTDANYLQESAVPLAYETHSGTDVPVYADGPAAWLLSGVREQNYLFHVMAHALFGPGD